jgi:hypothetical protein
MESVAYDCRKKSISQTTTLWTYIMKRAKYISCRSTKKRLYMGDDIIARKIGTLLKKNDSAIFQHAVTRLAHSRFLAMASYRRVRDSHQGFRPTTSILALPFRRLGLVSFLVITALLLSLVQGSLLDSKFSSTATSVHAYIIGGFNQLSLPESPDTSDDD